MNYTVLRSDTFDAWLKSLRDTLAKSRILARLRYAELGNLGDVKPVGEGVSEMRIDVGAGYRVYFTMRGREIIFLLTGGNKSTQDKDIKRAKEMAQELKG